MSEALASSIQSNLNEQSSEELLEIWRENNRAQWSAEYFDAVRAVLLARGVEIPPQKKSLSNDDLIIAATTDRWSFLSGTRSFPQTFWWICFAPSLLLIFRFLLVLHIAQAVIEPTDIDGTSFVLGNLVNLAFLAYFFLAFR